MAGVCTFSLFLSLTCLTFPASSDAKPNYEIVFEGVEVDRNPKHTIQTAFLRVGKFNQTTNVVNYEGNVTEDLPPDTIYTAVAFEKMASNKYSRIPVKLVSAPFCQIVDNDKMAYPAFLASSNFPEKCPITKGPYWIKNYIPDMSNMPDQLPCGERWRVDVDFSSPGKVHYKASAFVYVNRYI